MALSCAFTIDIIATAEDSMLITSNATVNLTNHFFKSKVDFSNIQPLPSHSGMLADLTLCKKSAAHKNYLKQELAPKKGTQMVYFDGSIFLQFVFVQISNSTIVIVR